MEKRFLSCVLFAQVFICLVARGVGDAEAKRPALSIMTVGDIDTAVQQRVISYIRSQYRVPPVLRDPIAVASNSVVGIKAQLVRNVRANDVALLALCAAPDIPHEGMVFKEERCGAINLSALKPSDEDIGDQAECFARRVEKESLRAIALMVGIEPCPFPRCALRAHANDKELDFKSRNPCPPCLAKVQNALQARGLKPLEESSPADRE